MNPLDMDCKSFSRQLDFGWAFFDAIHDNIVLLSSYLVTGIVGLLLAVVRTGLG